MRACSLSTTLEQHRRKRAENPRVARPFAHFPTGLVDVQNGGRYNEFGNRVVFDLPVRGQLRKERVGLRFRQFQAREEGKNSTSLKAQLLSYMKLLDIPLGLIINFNEPKLADGISRLILPGANRQ